MIPRGYKTILCVTVMVATPGFAACGSTQANSDVTTSSVSAMASSTLPAVSTSAEIGTSDPANAQTVAESQARPTIGETGAETTASEAVTSALAAGVTGTILSTACLLSVDEASSVSGLDLVKTTDMTGVQDPGCIYSRSGQSQGALIIGLQYSFGSFNLNDLKPGANVAETNNVNFPTPNAILTDDVKNPMNRSGLTLYSAYDGYTVFISFQDPLPNYDPATLHDRFTATASAVFT